MHTWYDDLLPVRYHPPKWPFILIAVAGVLVGIALPSFNSESTVVDRGKTRLYVEHNVKGRIVARIPNANVDMHSTSPANYECGSCGAARSGNLVSNPNRTDAK